MVKDLSQFIGKTATGVKADDDSLTLTFSDGELLFYHSQHCCEHVRIEDIAGDLIDLVGHPLLQIEEVSNQPYPTPPENSCQESFTWTFYKFATIKGSVTVRWLGESNGYYSESVDWCFPSNKN